jgi:hypothetical protein
MVNDRSQHGLAALLAAAICLGGYAQTSSHERIGVEIPEIAEITTGLAFNIRPLVTNGTRASELDPILNVDILIWNSFMVSLSLPAYGWLSLDELSPRRYAYAAGDPSVIAGYTFRIGDWRLGAGASYSYPLGIWNQYQVGEMGISSGTGYSTPGLYFSASRYLDPIVAGFAIKAQTGLARKELSGWSSRPLLLTLDSSATQAINANTALSLDVINSLEMPTRVNGSSSNAGFGYGLAGSASFIFIIDDNSLRVGISKDFADIGGSAFLNLGYAYIFRMREASRAQKN